MLLRGGSAWCSASSVILLVLGRFYGPLMSVDHKHSITVPNAIASNTIVVVSCCGGHKPHFSTMMPPPPPPPPKRASGTNGSSRLVAPPPPPLPKTKPAQTAYMASSSTSVPVPKSYEPYGEIPSSTGSSTAHRRHAAAAATNQPTFAYGVGSAPSKAAAKPSPYMPMPPSSYGQPKLKQERRTSAIPTATENELLQYDHNPTALAFLIPSLLSILWWHESPIILQTLLILGLILYGLDMVNARDALAVVAWISALIMTMVSGFATLLQVDDSEATGGAMILYLIRLAVEGLFFCTMVGPDLLTDTVLSSTALLTCEFL